MKKYYYVYILSNYLLTTFYIGVTNNLSRRLYEHKSGNIDGFTKKYRLTKLLYYETFNNSIDAIRREKQLKNWHNLWKVELIRSKNPILRDLLADTI